MNWLAAWFGRRRHGPSESNGESEAPESDECPKRMKWLAICRDPQYRGKWVALDACLYGENGLEGGRVVDQDADLAALCERLEQNGKKHCTVLLAEEGEKEGESE